MRTTTHALAIDRRLEPRRLVPRRQPVQPNDYESDARFAYLEWLEMEARLLRIELYPDTDPDRQPTPRGTFAKSFHFPSGQDWRAVPQPSTRAEAVLTAVGVIKRGAAPCNKFDGPGEYTFDFDGGILAAQTDWCADKGRYRLASRCGRVSAHLTPEEFDARVRGKLVTFPH